jgi:hypothetical protein
MAVPAVPAVTKPDASIEAVVGTLVDHVPPDTELDNAVD